MSKFTSTIACCLMVFFVSSVAFAQKTAKDFYQLSEKAFEGQGRGRRARRTR